MFGWIDELDDSYDEKAYKQVMKAETHEHKAWLSRELIVAAAAYAAAKNYEEHCEANGKPKNHAEAKELIVEFSVAFVDRVVEANSLDEIDTVKAKRDAANRALDQSDEILVAEYKEGSE